MANTATEPRGSHAFAFGKNGRSPVRLVIEPADKYFGQLCKRLAGDAGDVMTRLDYYFSMGWRMVPESGIRISTSEPYYHVVKVYKPESTNG